jgi:thioredoxin reductase (NADPH)
VQALKLQNGTVALFVVDQRMPQMSGIEFLERAVDLFPEAKKVLLTAYADTDAAIRAINKVRLDYYLMKPWDPPEQNFYPVLDEVLADWQSSYRPPFEGVVLVDHRWSPLGHQLRDFLARNAIPYRWLDIETSREAQELAVQAPGAESALPLVVLPDGSRLSRPSPGQIAERLGIATRATVPFYDLLIVGGGPAGLAAAVYGASEGLKSAIIEKEAPGGQAGTSSRIENYLGFPSGVSGGELARRALTQARRFGADVILTQEVVGAWVQGPYKFLRLDDASELSCHALLIASGVTYRALGAPGVDALTGAGVYYGAALSEAAGCQDQDIYVVGAGNSAGQGAMFLARYARSVTILCRGEGLQATMSRYLIDQIGETPNIRVRTRAEVESVSGDGRLETVTIKDHAAGTSETLPAGALFVYIGAEPHTDWLAGVVERDRRGFVLTGTDLMHDGKRPAGWPLDRDPFLLETSVPGIFAAGDVRHDSVKRVAAAVGEGSVTVQFVHRYLAGL